MDCKTKTDVIRKILDCPNVINSIELFYNNKSIFTSDENNSLEEALFSRLLNKDPLNFMIMFYKLNNHNSLAESDIAKILNKKGGSRHIMRSRLEGLEKLGYLKIYKKKHAVRPRYTYQLNKKYENIVKTVPLIYYCLIHLENINNPNMFFEYQKEYSLDILLEYIDTINEKLSYIKVEKKIKEEPFDATKIIKTLLDNDASIKEAFLVLNDVSKELTKLIPYIKDTPNVIAEEYIIKKIEYILEKNGLYRLLYSYRTEEILSNNGIEFNNNVVSLFKSKIQEESWDKKNTDVEIYSKVFYKMNNIQLKDIKDKKFLLSCANEFDNKNIKNIKISEYCDFIKKVALSILIKIGYLSTFSNPVGTLKNIIETQKNQKIKNIRSYESFDDFIKSLKMVSRLVQRIEDKKSIREEDLKNIIPYFHIILNFYDENF